MKKLMITIALLASFSIGNSQDIEFKKDQCTRCNMLIEDRQFAAFAEDKSGKIEKFDAIECLINFLKTRKEEDFLQLKVADYSKEGHWIETKNAIYLKSSAIPSPMGAYLSAYPDMSTAANVQKQKGGDLYNWSEIKMKFKNSNFGSLNHPDHHHNRSDAYASIGIMGDHLHHKGGWMISFRQMYMQMNGNQSGTGEISNEEIYSTYMAAPQNMNMQMYMLGIMYAPSDRLTLSVMLPYLVNDMEMRMGMGMGMGMGNGMVMTTFMDYQTKSKGFGDLKLAALYSLWSDENTSIHLNMGINIPQGNIENTDKTPMAEKMKLPYAMQLGSGTIDLIVGGTFKKAFEKSSFGIQPMAIIRTNENDQGYRFGNFYKANGWYAYGVNNWMSLTLRTEFSILEGISGEDKELNKMMAPQANRNNYGLTQLYTYGGLNLSFPNSKTLKNMRVGVEFGAPIYRDVEGIQMKERFTANSGIRYLL